MAKKSKTNGETDGIAEKKSGGGQAIDAPRTNAFKMDPAKLTIIGRDTNHKRGEHPLWDKRANNPPREDLVQAMMRYGWYGAIVVVSEGDMTIVDDGKQRTIAAREANVRLEKAGEERRVEVVCLSPVKGEDSKKAAILAMMNEHRTVDDMIERARKMENLLRFDATHEDIAIAFGESVQTVKNCLKTLECHSDIVKAAERGEVSPSVLVTLSALNRDDQMTEFEKMKAEGRLTVAQAQERVRNKKNGTSREAGEKNRRIPKKFILKILKLHKAEELETELPDDAIMMAAVLSGQVPPNRVRGFLGALRQVGYVDE